MKMSVPLAAAHLTFTYLLACINVVPTQQWPIAFLPSAPRLPPQTARLRCPAPGRAAPHRRPGTALLGGVGVARNYTWREEQYEIDVSVSVPAGTRTRDVSFRASSTGVDLRVDDGDGAETVLLDGARRMRGRVLVDGTYWALSDGDGGGKMGAGRQVTVTIEKMIKEPRDQFEVVDFDWGGVYPDDEEEVLEKRYDEPEELDVREYAKSLGVDIDNINMSMVDKTMFTSGLNMTRSTLDELSQAGYMKEVTQQADGTEYVTDDDGNAVPFSRLGDNIGEDEINEAVFGGAAARSSQMPPNGKGGIRDELPFIDTPAPWQKSMPAEEARIEEERSDGSGSGTAENGENDLETSNINGGNAHDDIKNDGVEMQGEDPTQDDDAADPIDLLKVKRLREILKEQNLKVSGNKQELRDRLRAHVTSMLTKQSKDEAVG